MSSAARIALEKDGTILLPTPVEQRTPYIEAVDELIGAVSALGARSAADSMDRIDAHRIKHILAHMKRRHLDRAVRLAAIAHEPCGMDRAAGEG